MQGFLEKICHVLSWILHPFFMPLYVYGVWAYSCPVVFFPIHSDKILYFIGFVVVMLLLLPLSLIYLLYRLGYIESLTLHTLSDRNRVFVWVLLTYVLVLYTLQFVWHVGALVWAFQLCMVICILTGGIITRFWKISLHTIGVSGSMIFFAYSAQMQPGNLLFTVFLMSVVAVGAIASARMWLGVHDLHQVLAGIGVGILTAVWIVVFLLCT